MLFSYTVWLSVIKFGTIRAFVHNRSSPILVNFGPLFWKHKFLTLDISGSFYRIVTKFGMVRGLANGHFFPEFDELWPTFPGAKIFNSGYLQHFCWSGTKFCSITVLVGTKS